MTKNPILPILISLILLCSFLQSKAQDIPSSSAEKGIQDSVLNITNLSPYINLHVDSILNYKLEVTPPDGKYFWYLRGAPVGVKINKDNGTLTVKAERSYFLSGRLRYDTRYNVQLGVHDQLISQRKIDTSFTIIYYNTEVLPSKLRPSVRSPLTVDEGDTVNFKLQCDAGSFPIEQINFYSGSLIKNYSNVDACEDEFIWVPPFDLVKDTDSGKVQIVELSFVGSDKFLVRDTATVRIIVRNALNYPLAVEEYKLQVSAVKTYLLQLKYSFLQLDRNIKKVKNTRTAFDITSSATALSGTILNTSSSESSQKVGKILPGVGISLVPVKEAVSPQKVYDQNQASLVRTSIKRLEYMLVDNSLIAEKDPNLVVKTNRLKEELKQVQIQLIDLPIGIDNALSEEELNRYFNSPKVNKKYRLKKAK